MTDFKFQLEDTVQIKVSGETGQIVGRAEFTACSAQYFIRYKAGDGRAIESWWHEEALEAA